MTLIRPLLILLVLSMCVSCASHGKRSGTQAGAQSGEPAQVNIDPWEGFNRRMFAFNSGLDRWVLKPVAKGYNYILPKFVKTGIGNFFSNVGEVGNIANDALQWKWGRAANDTGRLVVNSTIGLLGLFDVASRIGLEKSDGEDVGQTFESWGIRSGPYLVLPFFGSSTVRETVALPVDALLNPINYIDDPTVRLSAIGTNIVHTRYTLFGAESLISGDRYLFLRDAYLQRRQFLYNDGLITEDGDEDEFGDEDF